MTSWPSFVGADLGCDPQVFFCCLRLIHGGRILRSSGEAVKVISVKMWDVCSKTLLDQIHWVSPLCFLLLLKWFSGGGGDELIMGYSFGLPKHLPCTEKVTLLRAWNFNQNLRDPPRLIHCGGTTDLKILNFGCKLSLF